MSRTETDGGSSERASRLASFFELDAAKLRRCLAPGLSCENPAIRAHTIQNAAYLDQLCRDGHTVRVGRRFEPEGPAINFEHVGRNKATTFTGLCAAHDRSIFAPIETSPLDLENEEHLFLLAYRAALREAHATAEAGVKIQAAYQSRVEAGLDPKGQPSRAGLYATERLILAYETHLYKAQYDGALESRAFDALRHDVILIHDAAPSIGASAMFSLDHVPVGDSVARVCLTVLPLSGKCTGIVFSYLAAEATAARAALSRILDATGSHQLYEISRELLHSCENFVIAPSLFDTWSHSKRERILKYFKATLFRNDRTWEHRDLFLFWPSDGV